MIVPPQLPQPLALHAPRPSNRRIRAADGQRCGSGSKNRDYQKLKLSSEIEIKVKNAKFRQKLKQSK